MIRYMPDTWRDALWRPLSMAAPSGHVYVEIPAPDLRFVFVALLLVVTAWFALRGRAATSRATPILLFLVVLSFVPWLLTSGNGRYFIPFLLCAGPLCMGLLHALPVTRGMKAALVALMLSLQAFVVFSSEPLGIWALGRWQQAPYFQLSASTELTDTPHTFVAMTSISYSLVAPQFHPASRWINIANLADASVDTADQLRASTLLREARSLKLLIPALPNHSNADGSPTAGTREKLKAGLSAQKLELTSSEPCSFLRASGMIFINYGGTAVVPAAEVARSGFWICDLRRNEKLPQGVSNRVIDASANRVFEKVEKACPRLFPLGQVHSFKIDGGVSRGYPDSDIKLMVIENEGVFYKYWIALNPIRIGSVADVLSEGFRMNCTNIRGRSGLPWEREI